MAVIEELLRVFSSYTFLLLAFALVYSFGFDKRRYFFARLAVIPFYIIIFSDNYIARKLHISDFIMGAYGAIPYVNMHYIITAVICTLMLALFYREKALYLIFIVIIAYISEHMCSHIKQLAAWAIQGHETTLPPSSMVVEIVFAAVLAVIIKLLLKKYLDSGMIPRRKLIIAFMLVVIIALMGISSYVYSHVLFSVVTNLYEVLIAVLLFFLLFSIFGYSRKEHDEIVVKRLLDEQVSQSEQFNKNYEFVNMKFHDLKKQVRGLEEVMGKSGALEEIKSAIALHETNLDTGNPTLNIIISEYALTCRRLDIEFYCMAEGEAVNFLEEEDIYGIFHNALSNAVEAAEKCGKGERYVSVKVQRAGGSVRIVFENSTSAAPDVRDGELVTTKSNKAGHGFGMKSIKYILQKHSGNMTFSFEGGVFRLNILFMS